MNRVALITGASSSIGSAAARAFARKGYAVALTARRKSVLDVLASQIESDGGRALAVPADITDRDAVENLVRQTVQTFGGLDVAFNNAGGGAPLTPLADLEPEAFEEAVHVNLTGTFLAMRAQIRAMLERGAGAVVNMSSTAGLHGVSRLGAYCAAKHAIIGLTKAAALDYAAQNIRINAVAPGPIATERIKPDQIEQIGRYLPVQRIGEPQEVADLVVWLCSPEANSLPAPQSRLTVGNWLEPPRSPCAGD